MSRREPSNFVAPRRRWLRFSLRTFLLIVTVFCVWLGMLVNQARRQREAVEALRMSGFYVNYEHWRTDGDPETFNSSKELAAPTWLRNLTGDDFFPKVVAIRVLPTSSDEDYVQLAALPHIESLHLNGRGNDISDAGLAYLPRPDRLVHFEAGETLVGDGFVKRLASATGLVTLELSGTRVTDEGLRRLPRLPNLKRLGLGHTAIKDNGLAAALKDVSSLRSLSLAHTRITDASLALLENARKLWSLDLEGTRITDSGLRHLHGLPALEIVHVDGTLVTPEGMAALKAATPSIDRRLREMIELGKRQAGRRVLPRLELPAQDKADPQAP